MSAEPSTRLQRLLAQYEQAGQCKPLSYADVITRAQRLPGLANIYSCAEDALYKPVRAGAPVPSASEAKFNQGAALSQTQVCALYGWANYMLGKWRNNHEPAPFELQMLAYLYEAKPRYVSFANLGWTQANFVIWLYQDLIEKYEIGTQEHARFWLMTVRRPTREDILGRIRTGIGRRYTAAFNKVPFSFYKWISQNKVTSHSVAILFAKLLEPDDEQGYTRAVEPNFLSVREDLYSLSRFLYKAHELGEFDELFPAPELDSFLDFPMRRTRKYRQAVYGAADQVESKKENAKTRRKSSTRTQRGKKP